MLADELDYVVGVDTHRDEHAFAIVDARTGALIAQATTAARGRGYAEALRFADRHARGARVWAVEGSGHYGAGLVRLLQSNGEQVHEVERTSRAERRLRGKDDQLDAVRAARSALATKHRATPRGGQHQEALRLLLLARRSTVDTRRVGCRADRRRDVWRAAQALQPLPPLELARARRAGHDPRPAHTRPPHPDCDRGG